MSSIITVSFGVKNYLSTMFSANHLPQTWKKEKNAKFNSGCQVESSYFIIIVVSVFSTSTDKGLAPLWKTPFVARLLHSHRCCTRPELISEMDPPTVTNCANPVVPQFWLMTRYNHELEYVYMYVYIYILYIVYPKIVYMNKIVYHQKHLPRLV